MKKKMIVSAIKRLKGGTVENGVEFCCDKMKEAWGEKFINFGEYDEYATYNLPKVCIYKCRPYPEGVFWDNTPIKYCPFCKAKIKVVITEETNSYDEMIKELKPLVYLKLGDESGQISTTAVPSSTAGK